MSLFDELKRRNVFRVGAAYIVAAWLVIQVVETIFPAFGFGPATVRVVVIVLAIVFIPVLIFAWVFELTPEGVKRDHEVARGQSITPRTGKKLDRIIIVMLALALGYFAIDKFVLSGFREALIAETAREEGRSAAFAESYGDKSIAVLPFVNMSADPDNEYFSDGISEELINVLVKVEGLKVAAPTSAFQFKEQNHDIKEIGRKLSVNTVLEGSVRRAGNRVRITAKLINVGDGYHMWSGRYDRELDDIFALQEEIATAIVDALAVTLDGETVQVAEREGPTDNIEAYQLYLRGRHLWRQRGAGPLYQSIALFKQAIELDPGFARAHSNLADAYAVLDGHDFTIDRDLYFSLAESSARTALAINPELAEAHAVLGYIFLEQNQWMKAQRALHTAVEVGPNDPGARYRYAFYLLETGYTKQGLSQIQRAYELDPLNAAIARWHSIASLQAGRNEESLKYAAIAAELGLTLSAYQSLANQRLGNDDLAEKQLIEAFSAMGYPTDWVPLFIRALGDRSAVAEAESRMVSLKEHRELPFIDVSAFVLLILLGSDQVFTIDVSLVPSRFTTLWYEEAAGLRQDPRFSDLVERIGFVEVWREFGWPDLCEPTDDGGFRCQ